MKLDELEEVMALVPEGGHWRDLPEDVARRVMGNSYESSGGRTSYFRRLHRDLPAPTIVGSPAQKSTLLWHPTENRAISVEEASALQSFPTREWRTEVNTDHVVLDGFAGTGVGVALQRLGVPELGIEIMPEAIATREANGMNTIYEDIWDAHLAEQYDFDTVWMSPPCQKFSLAGGGEGRRALDNVIDVIRRRRYRSIEWLKEESVLLGDDKIGLVLTPLFYAYKFRPTYFLLEQVPPVLPVWEAMAEVLRLGGYSVWTGILNAEQYGVPQTRKRAILIARKDGKEAKPPRPTHSCYYPRDKTRLDPGVHKWVSMAEALGWSQLQEPAMLRSNYGTSGDPEARGERESEAPAPTITSKANRNKWLRSNQRSRGIDYVTRDVENPALTIAGTSRSMQFVDEGEVSGRNMTAAEAATLQSYPPFGERGWGYTDRPAPTVTGGGGKASGIELFDQQTRQKMLAAIETGEFIPNGKVVNPNTPLDPIRLQPDEAATLQSYPPFIWKGAKTKQFLQIGNAVPPLLAQVIFEEVWSK